MPSAATWLDLDIVRLSEVSQTEKDKYHIISLICGIYKNGTDELVCRAETETQMQRTNIWTPRGESGVVGMVEELKGLKSARLLPYITLRITSLYFLFLSSYFFLLF